MRIVLISGIVFVHVPYDPATSPYAGNYGGFDWLRVFLGDSLFRVGVPCLSAISGYLLFRRGLDRFDYRKTLKTKARTVLLPFLLWNGAFLALVFVAQGEEISSGYLPDVADANAREWLTLVFALEGMPINLPLYFLRDLLLCIVLSPALAWLIKRYPAQTLAVLLVYVVLPFPNGIFLKKSILLGFSAGIYLSLHEVDIRRFDRFSWAIVVAFIAAALLLSALLYQYGPDFPIWLDMLRSLTALFGIAGSWAVSALLVRTSIGASLARVGGLSFWIFCTHFPLLVLFWMIWNRMDVAYYPTFYCTAPFVAIATLACAHALARRWLPNVTAILTGSRTGSTLKASERAPTVRSEPSPQQRT
ncbi:MULTISPECIES: acyltransferase [unclassified Ensifer]|uniref:acyltransferase family protein n=1 Tax=unclassified Ensifer TaxID=2633371 RepID=UPI000A597C91|nr:MULTISPECIES: acyltransferase [unclassified Ensifer]